MHESKQMNIEQMLTWVAESSQFSGWDDELSRLVSKTILHFEKNALSEDMLESVAGGIKLSENQIDDKGRGK